VAASSNNGGVVVGGTMFGAATAIVGGSRFMNILPEVPVISGMTIGLLTLVSTLAGVGIGTMAKHHAQDGAQQLRPPGR
jgi:hypothetical protein